MTVHLTVTLQHESSSGYNIFRAHEDNKGNNGIKM
jgi:hypothetical protein